VPRGLGHRDNYFGTINYLQNSNFRYNIYKRTILLISIQKNEAGLNRAEVLTVLLALVLLHHIFYKNGRGLTLFKVRLFLFHLKKPPSLKVVMGKWFYH